MALTIANFKKNGFFVEFGATDGLYLSNTYILEKHFNWDGILAEPARSWHDKLQYNRQCFISHDCVWKSSHQSIRFSETQITELSGIASSRSADNNHQNKEEHSEYNVNTISLLDLLKSASAPKTIDYLSVDTEGSEYSIMKDFPFNDYKFNFITIEHNYGRQRKKLNDLFCDNGYIEIMPHLSSCDFWFVNAQIIFE
jgi:FkbM family methyltransferase